MFEWLILEIGLFGNHGRGRRIVGKTSRWLIASDNAEAWMPKEQQKEEVSVDGVQVTEPRGFVSPDGSSEPHSEPRLEDLRK